MKYKFQLPSFPNSQFEIETSIWTGKSKLSKDGVLLEQLKESGKPFLIPNSAGELIKAFPKQNFPDLAPVLEINGEKFQLAEKLKWQQYVIGALPILLLFIGGALGGVIGALGTTTNFNLFRQEGSNTSKYVKVMMVVFLSFAVYLTFAIILTKLMN